MHQLATQYGLASQSYGSEPRRHIELFKVSPAAAEASIAYSIGDRGPISSIQIMPLSPSLVWPVDVMPICVSPVCCSRQPFQCQALCCPRLRVTSHWMMSLPFHGQSRASHCAWWTAALMQICGACSVAGMASSVSKARVRLMPTDSANFMYFQQ